MQAPAPNPGAAHRERGVRRRRRVALVVLTSLVLVTALVALFTIPATHVIVTGTIRSSLTSTTDHAFLDTGYPPTPSQCTGSTSYLCTNLWIAFNWSTLNGQAMTFQILTESAVPFPNVQTIYLYNATGLSFGGYVMDCSGTNPYCDYPLQVFTNDSTGLAWYVQWIIFYDYPSTQPLL